MSGASEQSRASKKYKQDVDDTMKDLTASKPSLSAAKARSRASLGAIPLARFRSDVADAVRAELDRTCQAPEEKKLDAELDRVTRIVFLSRVLDTADRMPEPRAVDRALADLKKGRIWTHVPTWQGLLASVPEPAAVAVRHLLTRTRDELVASAKAHAKGNRPVDAAVALAGVTALDPDNNDAVILTATTAEDARAQRDKAMQSVNRASRPSELLDALFKVDAIDSISKGQGSSVKPEERRAIFSLVTAIAGDDRHVLAGIDSHPSQTPGAPAGLRSTGRARRDAYACDPERSIDPALASRRAPSGAAFLPRQEQARRQRQAPLTPSPKSPATIWGALPRTVGDLGRLRPLQVPCRA